MVSLRQGATGIAIVALLGAFFLLNLFPLPFVSNSSSQNPSAPCNTCNVPAPPKNMPSGPGQPFLIVSSTELNATVGSTVQEYFTVGAPYGLNLTTIGQQGFTVSLAPASIVSPGNYSDLMIITVASSTQPAAYPFTLETLSGQSVVVNQSMILEVTQSGSNQSSNLYFGVLNSYNYSITRELIGSGGSVISQTKLQAAIAPPSLSGLSATFLEYVVNITANPIQNPPPNSAFIVTVVSLGYEHLSSVSSVILAVGNNGWSLNEYQFNVPISGGIKYLYLNTTDALTGLFYAQHDNQTFSRLGSGWETAVSQGSIGTSAAIAPVSITIQIIDSNNQLDNISSRFDFVSLPINPMSCGLTTLSYPGYAQFPPPSTTTRQTTTDTQYSSTQLGVYIQASASSGPAPFTAQFEAFVSGGTGGYSYSWSFGDGASLVRGSNPIATHTYTSTGLYLVQVTVTDGLGDSGSTSFKIDVYSSTYDTVVVTACSASYTGTGGGGGTGNSHVRVLSMVPNGGLSFFGLGNNTGVQDWALNVSYILDAIVVISFGLHIFAFFRARHR